MSVIVVERIAKTKISLPELATTGANRVGYHR
jgi:hypothetical protein